jgi:tyrosine-protein phosphatase YwqE
LKQYEVLKNRGFWFQMNLNSLTGLYGLPSRVAAGQLIDAGMIDMVGTDAHHSGHLQGLGKLQTNRGYIKLMQTKILLNSEL